MVLKGNNVEFAFARKTVLWNVCVCVFGPFVKMWSFLLMQGIAGEHWLVLAANEDAAMFLCKPTCLYTLCNLVQSWPWAHLSRSWVGSISLLFYTLNVFHMHRGVTPWKLFEKRTAPYPPKHWQAHSIILFAGYCIACLYKHWFDGFDWLAVTSLYLLGAFVVLYRADLFVVFWNCTSMVSTSQFDKTVLRMCVCVHHIIGCRGGDGMMGCHGVF